MLDYQWNEVLIPYWKKTAEFAKAHGVTKIAFEMHPGFCVYNPETLLKLRAAVGDVIGANFDPSHLIWQGIDPVAAIRAEREDLPLPDVEGYAVDGLDDPPDDGKVVLLGILEPDDGLSELAGLLLLEVVLLHETRGDLFGVALVLDVSGRWLRASGMRTPCICRCHGHSR